MHGPAHPKNLFHGMAIAGSFGDEKIPK